MKKIKKILSLMLVVLTAGFAPLVNGMYQENISDEERLILESKDPFIMIGFDDYKPGKGYSIHASVPLMPGHVPRYRVADKFCRALLSPLMLRITVNKVAFKRCSDISVGENVYTYTDRYDNDQPFNVRITLYPTYVLVESSEIPARCDIGQAYQIGENIAKDLLQQARAVGLKIEDCPDI